MKILRIISLAVPFLFYNLSYANIVGSDLENFNPTTDGLGYVTVESGELHEPGIFNLGLFLDYGVKSLPQADPGGSAPDDQRASTNIHVGVGITKGWSVGFSMTNLIHESSEATSLGAAISETGREAFRLDSKVRLVNEKKAQLGAFFGINFNNIDNNPYLGRDPGPSVAVGGFYERLSSKSLRWAINAGYRLRNSGAPLTGFGIEPIDNQIFYSLGANYWHERWDTHFIGELYGSTPTNSPLNNTDRELSNLEILLGAKQKFYERMDVHVGMTRGLYTGLSTPELRIYAGVNINFSAISATIHGRGEHGGIVPAYEIKDQDEDGVRDQDDRCPNTLEGTTVDHYGCPLNIDSGFLDDDFDGVDNSEDQCPNTKIDVKVDASGCPSLGNSDGAAYATLDSDGDGVINEYDLCPDTPEGVDVTNRGCEIHKIQNVDLGVLNFISGTAKLTKKSRNRFKKKIKYLLGIKNSIKKIVIEGHTDSVGKAAYNKRLSQQRANTIKGIIVEELGISRKKVEGQGFGESRPIASNKTKLGRLKNRRVEMHVISR